MTHQTQADPSSAVAPSAPSGSVSPGSALVEARGVAKGYPLDGGTVPVLRGVSLRVRPRELVAVMGPSGSGKSTLLYCLAGLEAPEQGMISLAGRDLATLGRTARAQMRRGEVGFVFQSYNLLPTLTAAQNVALPATLAGRRADPDLVSGALAAVGLAGREGARPPSMSGGEQQRVALARALAQAPTILFADEPTGALDSRTGALVLAELVRIAHRSGHCGLLVTHDPGVAAACDRVLFLRDGALVAELPGGSAGRIAATLAALTAEG